FKRHILTKKDKSRKKDLAKAGIVHSTDMNRVAKMLCI
ncbi:MAG: Ribosomal protein, partial [Bacteroidota bacterium]